VAAPAGHQPARHRLCRNNHRLLAFNIRLSPVPMHNFMT
jgi:hypothetical protein